MSLRFTILVTCILLAVLVRQLEADDAQPIFESDVQPLLAEKCGKCHCESVSKGELDLSTIGGLRRGGETGEALVTDSLNDSLLWIQVVSGQMPPEGEPPLLEPELKLIRKWIVSGARSSTAQSSAQQQISQHDVLPVMLLRCTACHGAQNQDGGLDLRSKASMIAGGKSGPALIPGDAGASPMIQRIESNACPPSDRLLESFVRRPPTSEVKTLRDWIAAGAPELDALPDSVMTGPDRLVTEDDRQHWAFQPPRKLRKGGSIDQFIGQKLAVAGLVFSREADRDTLIRRVHIDLVGMPPSPEVYRRWRDSNDPDWYSTMVDQLLASPHYGQRWGRYWLDLAGYADSEGGISDDPVRAVAWKYRDYVIDAFNNDKPYDQFLIQQLAGDELLDHEHAAEITPEMVENLVATGFLRMGIDETGSRTMNFVPQRLNVISDAINIVSSGLMGLTMECARCHSHKYDPIPHRDYYRFKAIFQGALDEYDWSSFKTRKLRVATATHHQRVAEVNPPIEKQIRKLESRQKQVIESIQLGLLQHHYPEQSAGDNQQTLAALRIADNNRTLPQRELVERLQLVQLLPDSQQPEAITAAQFEVEQLNHEVDRLRRRMVAPLEIRALWDLGRPSPTYILRRGEHDKPAGLVAPGVPAVLTDGQTPWVVEPPFPTGTQKTGRRLALARWLTEPDHPLTSRVMVNRIWYHHFGTGLAKDLDNFGIQADPPSHPGLLDFLATEFINRDWSVKAMHRLILNSRTYRQSSAIMDRQQEIDPENRLLSHRSIRRMDAEALRDSLLMVSGRLEDTPGGLPDTVSVNRDGLVRVNPTEGGGWRRSLYLPYRRTEIPTIMDTFDYPQMGPNCSTRTVSTISPQPLLLMNNSHIRDLASALADRTQQIVDQQISEDHELDPWGAEVDCVYQLALCRTPNQQERQIGVEALQGFQTAWQGSKDRALETYCHVIFNSAAFLYVD